MDYNKREFERLFKDSYRQMYRLAYSIVGDEHDARDAVSQVFAQMWHTKPKVADSSVSGYLLAATRNQSFHILRQRQLRLELENELKNTQSCNEQRERQELMDELQRVIEDSLTEQDRRVLALHYDEEMTYGETAERLGISVSAVNKHITRSLSKIRQTLKIAKPSNYKTGSYGKLKGS